MSGKPDFVKQVLDAYSKMKSEIDRSASEYDVRHRIIKHIVEGLLGYTGKDYQAEKEKTDIKLLDESHSLVLVVVETKKEMREIPDKIKGLQREIDQRVYKLYGLSKDDIQVIEESID